MQHLNVYFSIDKRRQCIGTFSVDAVGQMEAAQAVAKARQDARASGLDTAGASHDFVFVDTDLLVNPDEPAKSPVREFDSLDAMVKAAEAFHQAKKGA